MALQEGAAQDLRNTAGAIQGRSARVCNVVEAEMDNYEPCIYTKRVLEAVKVLREQGLLFIKIIIKNFPSLQIFFFPI